MAFMEIPKDERRYAGAIWHFSARFDWHFRVWLAVWARMYSKADDGVKKEVLSQMWDELVLRFPDLDPANPVRGIGASGGRDLLQKYRRVSLSPRRPGALTKSTGFVQYQRINSWVQTVSRSMRNARTARTSGSTGAFMAPRRVPGMWKALVGKQRATTAFEFWADDEANIKGVNAAVEKELDALGLQKGSQARNRKAIGVRRSVRSRMFKELTDSEKAPWQEKAQAGGGPRNTVEA